MRAHYSFLIALLLGALGASAQAPVQHVFEADPPLDMLTIRPVIELVKDLDPNGKVLWSDDMTILKIRIHPSVIEGELRQAITSKGVALREGTPTLAGEEPVYTTPEGRPLYVLTGDEAADRARYEQAVQQWNQNNPNDPISLPVQVRDDR